MTTAKMRLTIHEMSRLAIPDGGSLQDGIDFLLSLKKGRSPVVEQAEKNVEAYIAAVKSAPDNPWKTDEEICEEILRRVNEIRKHTKLE